jgi:adenylate kinase family enzyme
VERILVIGSGGAGKSTFSPKLGEILGLPVIHLDTLFWKPGWVETPKDEWATRITAEIQRPRWIIDGNFGGTMEIRLAACDTVIFLNLSRWICLWRVLSRRLRYHRKGRPDMTAGCPERLDFQFLKWIWTYPTAKAPQILERLESLKATANIFVLRSPQEVEAFLEKLRKSQGKPCAS